MGNDDSLWVDSDTRSYMLVTIDDKEYIDIIDTSKDEFDKVANGKEPENFESHRLYKLKRFDRNGQTYHVYTNRRSRT